MTHTLRTTRRLGRLMIGASLLLATSMTAGTLLPLGADDGTDARPSEIDEIPDLADVPAEVLTALAGSFTQLSPARLVDTRKGANPQKFGTLDGTGAPMEITITSGRTFDDKATGLPASGISAVALNVTVVDGRTNDYGGYITVYPCGTRPDASNLNYVTGQTVPNAVIAPVSTTGKICIHNYGQAHLLVDVSGYFTTGFTDLTPARLVDTRKGANPQKFGTLDGTGAPMEITITSGRTFDDKATGLPASGISAVALNVTVVDGRTNDYGGYITVYPCGTRPDASNLNYVTGQTVPNAVIAPVSTTGKICIHNYGQAHLLVDVSGYFGG